MVGERREIEDKRMSIFGRRRKCRIEGCLRLKVEEKVGRKEVNDGRCKKYIGWKDVSGWKGKETLEQRMSVAGRRKRGREGCEGLKKREKWDGRMSVDGRGRNRGMERCSGGGKMDGK